jgi:hypothetical protein
MPAKSTYLGGKLIAHVLGGPDYTRPERVFLGLHTANPLASGAEVTGNNYARAAIVNDAQAWTASGSAGRANAQVVAFTVPSGSWGTVTHVGIYDAPTGGNLLYGGPLTRSLVPASGDQVQVAAGDVVVFET